jgi:HK97 family phage prohead protease
MLKKGREMKGFEERSLSAAMYEKRVMQVALEMKSVSEEGRFAGYASVFHVADSQKDVVLPGAFVNTIRGRVGEIRLLWQHDPAQPVGEITRLFEDSRGLYLEGQLFTGVAKAREALVLMKQGVVSGLSIGYSPVRYSRNAQTGLRELREVMLWEVSLVTFPANEQSRISVVKSAAAASPEDAAEEAALRGLDGALRRLEHSFGG